MTTVRQTTAVSDSSTELSGTELSGTELSLKQLLSWWCPPRLAPGLIPRPPWNGNEVSSLFVPSSCVQGLAGSSAIITATLKCLMKFYHLTEAVSFHFQVLPHLTSPSHTLNILITRL